VTDIAWGLALVAGVGAIVWGAESFAEHLSAASVRLGVSAFALALLLAGAEPEELATAIVASARHVPAVALGDVVGANVAMCLVALGLGACIAPLPFGRRVQRYAVLGLPAGIASVVVMWDGDVSRLNGALLLVLYAGYVAIIWALERHPPVIGEAEELDEARQVAARGVRSRVGRDLVLVVAGVVAMGAGATVLVEAVRRITSVESSQTDLSLTLVGFVTAFELVVLAWSASRRGASETVIAAVVGSFAYNSTMTLGAAALVRPLRVIDASRLHGPAVVMLGSLTLVVVIGSVRHRLTRAHGVLLLALYPVFLAYVISR
jgi:cation:H+ antiporter